ncbi:231_t:CDS:2 [Cetraspora pellucida]|uniref:231_t:CDS:1 n=1 Tax=Cetraspora pellucida TaxID=1433469 RepID=A0ACA9LZH0_9GLOM|nr:231_t:CDS:2 [Cetraspora pellucida]
MEFFHPNDVSILVTVLSLFVVVFSLVSMFVKERLYLSEPLVCVAVGIALGPIGLNVVAPEKWGGNVDLITKEFTRFVIAIQVLANTMIKGRFAKKYISVDLRDLISGER